MVRFDSELRWQGDGNAGTKDFFSYFLEYLMMASLFGWDAYHRLNTFIHVRLNPVNGTLRCDGHKGINNPKHNNLHARQYVLFEENIFIISFHVTHKRHTTTNERTTSEPEDKTRQTQDTNKYEMRCGCVIIQDSFLPLHSDAICILSTSSAFSWLHGKGTPANREHGMTDNHGLWWIGSISFLSWPSRVLSGFNFIAPWRHRLEFDVYFDIWGCYCHTVLFPRQKYPLLRATEETAGTIEASDSPGTLQDIMFHLPLP